MEIIFFLLPLGLGIALFFLAAYIWAVRTGQFDDTTTPAYRILIDDAVVKSETKSEISNSNTPRTSNCRVSKK